MSKNLILSAANRERVKELLDRYAKAKDALNRVTKARGGSSVSLSITSERNTRDFVDVELCPRAVQSALAVELTVIRDELLKLNISVK